MRLDLHIHTTASDGDLDPENIVAAAIAGALDVISITDHDTTAAVMPAVRAAEGSGLRVIPGTELSSTRAGREIHILGYDVDPEAPVLQAHRTRAREIRLDRMRRIIEGLAREEGIRVSLDDVLAAAGPNRDMVGRPHLAQVLIDQNHARDFSEVFRKLIGDHCPSFVSTDLQAPEEAVETILEAGGLPVWAHPPLDLLDDLLDPLADAGLLGLEVHRPEARPSQIKRLRAAARSRDLFTSGGSDWHNLRRNSTLGTFWVGRSKVEPLLEALGID